MLSQPFDDGDVGLAATFAHGLQAVAATGVLQFVQQHLPRLRFASDEIDAIQGAFASQQVTVLRASGEPQHGIVRGMQRGRLVRVASPDAQDGAIRLNADAALSQLRAGTLSNVSFDEGLADQAHSPSVTISNLVPSTFSADR